MKSDDKFQVLADSESRLRELVVRYFLTLEDATVDDLVHYDQIVTTAENDLRTAVGLPMTVPASIALAMGGGDVVNLALPLTIQTNKTYSQLAEVYDANHVDRFCAHVDVATQIVALCNAHAEINTWFQAGTLNGYGAYVTASAAESEARAWAAANGYATAKVQP